MNSLKYYIILLIYFFVFVCQGNVLATEIKRKDVNSITIDQCGIKFNGHELPLNGDLNVWKAVLGQRTRQISSKNIKDYFVLVYDELGLILIGSENLVTKLNIFFMDYEDESIKNKAVYEFSPERGMRPNRRYQGNLDIQNAKLAKNMGIEEILDARKQVTEDYKLQCLDCPKDNLLVYKGKGIAANYFSYTGTLCNDKAYRLEYHLAPNKQLQSSKKSSGKKVHDKVWEPAIHYFSIREMNLDEYSVYRLKEILSFRGDGAWKQGNKERALKEYGKHIDYMKSVGREDEIKEAVFERVESIKKDKAEWEKNNPGIESIGDYKTPKTEFSEEEYMRMQKEFNSKIEEIYNMPQVKEFMEKINNQAQ